MTIGTAAEYVRHGFAALDQGRPERARRLLRQAAAIDPGNPHPLYALGFWGIRRQDPAVAARALSAARMALSRRSGAALAAEIFLATGILCRQRGDAAAAALAYRRSAAIRPDAAAVWQNLTNAEAEFREAAPALRPAGRAVVLAPGSADAWNNLGRLRNDSGDLAGAEAALRRAAVLDPGHPHATNTLGIVRKRGDAIDGAVAAFRRAAAIRPLAADVQANLGRNLLLTGDFGRGWAALEADWRRRGFAPRDGGFRFPVWDGRPLADGALLVWCEDKIGDEILFARFLAELPGRAGPVVFLCNPRLEALFRRSFPGLDLLAWDGVGAPPLGDRRIAACYPLDFVGRHLRRCFADFPPPGRYLVPPARPTPVVPGLRVGIAWHSVNPLIGRLKSLPLADWAPILTVPGARFVSLQYGDTAAERAVVERALGVAIEQPAGVDQMADIDGFAGFVAGLDLVISIPNTTVHVAGALGVPCWVLLPAGAGLSWFWFRDRDAALWYPRMRLYRQMAVGEWASLRDRVAADLAALASDAALRGPALRFGRLRAMD